MATNQPSGTDYAGMYEAGIGGLTSAYAQYMAGRANQRIARWNASQARVQAAQAIQAGQFAEGRAEIAGAQTLARERGAEAGAGIIAGAGTARTVEASSAAATDMDRRMIELNARRQAYGYQVRAAGSELEGDQAAAKGDMGALATLLNTGSQEWLDSDPSYGGYRGRGIASSFGGGH